MPRFACLPWLWTLALAVTALATLPGCADNPMVLQGQVNKLQQQQMAVWRQNQQLQARASALDRDNQELGSLLAQSRQQTNVLDDQLAAVFTYLHVS